MTNIIVAHDGRQYRLIDDAYMSNMAFEANAICLDDTPDEEGWQPCYLVCWDILNEYIDFTDDGKPYLIPDCSDESDMADWDNPYGVIEHCEYNIQQSRFA